MVQEWLWEPGSPLGDGRESDISFNKAYPVLHQKGLPGTHTHTHPRGPSLTDTGPTVWRQCITELTPLKMQLLRWTAAHRKIPFPPWFKGFHLSEILPKAEGRNMLAISEAESPGLLARSTLTCSLRPGRGNPFVLPHSHRTFAPHPKTAQRNGAAGTLEKGMSSLLALPLSSSIILSWATHSSRFSSKASRKYSSQATAIIPQVSPATLAKAEGLLCLELPEAQGLASHGCHGSQ